MKISQDCIWLEVEDFTWDFPQNIPEKLELHLQSHYGFNSQYSGMFTNLQADISEIIDLADPEISTESSRRQARILDEDASFDEEYYM